MKQIKDKEAIRFMAAVMDRVGAANPTDLSKIMGGPWPERDQQRRLYKWAAGEQAPNFLGTLSLLHVAGLLSLEELYGGGAVVNEKPALDETPDDIATAVAAVVKEMRAGFRKIDRRLVSLEQQRTAEEGQSPPIAREA